MSNYKAIGAITQSLVKLIEENINVSLSITAKVISIYPELFFKENDNAINVHLYHIKENANYKNNFLAHRNSSGDKANVSYLCLDLYYTICVRSDEQFNNDLMLGYAMLRLFDNPILDKSYFSNHIESISRFSDVNISNDNIENVRITMENLTVDEVSKIWSIFNAPYRPAAYYKVTLVLMRNAQEFQEGLPVKEVMLSVSPKENIAMDTISKV